MSRGFPQVQRGTVYTHVDNNNVLKPVSITIPVVFVSSLSPYPAMRLKALSHMRSHFRRGHMCMQGTKEVAQIKVKTDPIKSDSREILTSHPSTQRIHSNLRAPYTHIRIVICAAGMSGLNYDQINPL